MGFTECLVYSGQNGFDTIGETHMRSTQSLRSGPCVALNQLFQYWFDSRRPSLVLSRKIVERFHFLRLSPPGDRWCDVLGFVPAVNDSSSSTLQIFRRKLLEMVALPASLSAWSFPFTPACPGLYTHSFRRWMSTIDTF